MKNIDKLFLTFIIASLVFSSIPYASAMFQASIIPPQPYTVTVGQSYSLKVSIQYDIPQQAVDQIGPIQLWVFSSPYSSSKVPLVGKGTYSFSLPLTAPSQEGTYTLGIKLYVNSQIHKSEVYDTATVSYQVITPTVNDWAVTKVWITPDSPSPDDEVTFHATIALKSTTGKGTQMAAVGCFLNDRPFGKTQLLSFQYPSSQDIQAPIEWTAEEGSYRLRFAVEDFNYYQDKFIQDNIRDYVFSVEPYYAIINGTVISPFSVESGDGFIATVYVVYSFPESTELRIGIIFPVGNLSYGFNMTADQIQSYTVTVEGYDTVSGTGSGPYSFNLTAPTIPFTVDPMTLNATEYMGISKVEFDRGEGAGWEYTDPGFADDFQVFVTPHTYYAVIDISDIAYLGEASPFDPNNPKGRFRANIEVDYLLPEENAKLRVMLTESKGTKIYDGTSGAKGEGKRTYPIEFELPLDVEIKDYSELFDVEVSYEVEEKWYSGDSRSSSAPVSISEEAISAKPGPPSGSAFEPVTDFFRSIADFFKGLFGLQDPWIYRS